MELKLKRHETFFRKNRTQISTYIFTFRIAQLAPIRIRGSIAMITPKHFTF